MGWFWLGLLGLVLLLSALAVLFAGRVRALGNRVGSFECALRPAGEAEWTSGIAVYGVQRLDWHRTVSLAMRPHRQWARGELDVIAWERRSGAGGPTGVIEATCSHRGEEFELALRSSAFFGLTSWLESLPPGDRLYSER